MRNPAGLDLGAAGTLGIAVAYTRGLPLGLAMRLLLRELLGDFAADKGHSESDDGEDFGVGVALDLASCAQS